MDRATRQAIEAPRSDWEPYVDEAAHRLACAVDMAQAKEHAMSPSAERHRRWLLAPRLETLALMMGIFGAGDSPHLGERFQELLGAVEGGVPAGPNRAFVAQALATGLSLCSRTALALFHGGEAEVEAWAQGARAIRWAHFDAFFGAAGFSGKMAESGLMSLSQMLCFPASPGQGGELRGRWRRGPRGR